VILKQHLETCVVEAIRGQNANKVIEELLQVFKHAPSLYTKDEDNGTSITESSSQEKNNSAQSGCCH
jgi:hypothetical protein